MKRTHLSLYYLVGYLIPAGIALIVHRSRVRIRSVLFLSGQASSHVLIWYVAAAAVGMV